MEFQELITRYASHYQITKWRVQQGKTYREIAKQSQLSISCVRRKYRCFLWKLFKFYARYLAEEIEDVGFKSHINDVICFYSEPLYGIAYLEQVYADILEKCRNGMPPVVTVQFPAFREISPSMEKKVELQIVEKRDIYKKGFNKIARELGLTQEKVYELYHRCKSREELGDEERWERNKDVLYHLFE